MTENVRTPLPRPPAGSDVVVEEIPGGRRVTLPRHYTRADLVVAVLAGAVAVWMAVWVRSMAGDYPRPSSLGLAVMGAVALVFAVVALSEGLNIAARQTIEERDDALVVGRRLGVRTVRRRVIPRSDIEATGRARHESALTPDAASPVRLTTADGDVVLGKGLDPLALAWLEEATRRMAGDDDP